MLAPPRSMLALLLATGAHGYCLRTPTRQPVRMPSLQQPVHSRRAVAGRTVVCSQADGVCPSPEADGESCPTSEVRTLELFRFIVPTLAGWLSSEVMSVVDTAVVGSCSAAELAALGPATMLTDSTAYLFFWLNIATTSLFAQRLAARDERGAYDVLSDALWCALGCGLLLTGALHWFGEPALRLICAQAPSVVPAASRYLSIRLLGLPAFMVGTVLQAACLGAKDSASPLLVLLASGSLNLVLDIYLVKRVGMGIGGAALATLVAQLLQVALLALVVARKRAAAGVASRSDYLLLRGRPSSRRLGTFLAFAGPMAFVLFGKIACYNSMTLAATTTGVAALAAHQVMVSVFFLCCKFGDAVSQTAQTYLPACFGAEGVGDGRSAPPREARAMSMRLLRLSTGLGAFVSLAAYGFVTRMPHLFTADAGVKSLMRRSAPMLLAATALHPTCMCTEGLLIGSRQLNFLAGSYAVNIGIFLSVLAAIARSGLPLTAVWKALAAFQAVRLTTFTWRGFTSGLLGAGGARAPAEPTQNAAAAEGAPASSLAAEAEATGEAAE